MKTCGLGCGGNDPDCVTLCGRPDGKGRAALPAQIFKKLIRLTKKAAEVRFIFIFAFFPQIYPRILQDNGKAFGLAESDVTLLQSALRQQVGEVVGCCEFRLFDSAS